jgi:hypothetical protein
VQEERALDEVQRANDEHVVRAIAASSEEVFKTCTQAHGH